LGRRVDESILPELRAGGAAVVLLTRVAPRTLDTDNLERALKAVRDGVAEAWGINDADPRVEWLTDQRAGVAAVELSVWALPTLVSAFDPSDYERPAKRGAR
jgi:hypothetical protein